MVLQCSQGDWVVFSLPHKTPDCYLSLGFYTWYSVASKVSNFGLNISSIKSTKSSYKAKSGSKGSHMRGMNEYIAAEREAGEQEMAAEL